MCVTAEMNPGIEALERLKAIRWSASSKDDGLGTVTLEEHAILKKLNTRTHICGDSERDNRPLWPLAP